MKFTRLCLAVALAALPLFAAAPAQAQDRAQTILVLDASGSMWGQIDGKAKITIAQEVIADLLATIPADQNLGLTVYGHREKGNCADIETVVAPGPNTREAIAAAVAGIQPKGKTPMTDAVIAAAEAMRYTEEKATVILVSDGIETCNPDPCAAALALEATGVDFTAHVIGFDVQSDPKAQAQMQCLAANTGGQFLPAENAAELAEALFTIVDLSPEPKPVVLPVTVTFRALEAENPAPLDELVLWEIKGPDGAIATGQPSAGLELALLPAVYSVSAVRISSEDTASTTFEVADAAISVDVVFPRIVLLASVAGPGSAPLGAMAEVNWTGPNEDRDYIAVASPDVTDYINFAYTRDGSPVSVEMPGYTGTYELRYVRENGEILARQAIEVTPVDVSLDAPETAVVGEDLAVSWTGPDYKLDYIAVARPGEKTYVNYTYTRERSPLNVEMPAEPGEYELRYVLNQGSVILASRPISVGAVEVNLTAADTAAAGAQVEVTWIGPNYDLDYIAVGLPGEKTYINYTYTRDGSPLNVEMPVKPGTYELRYVLSQDSSAMATRPITVTALSVSLAAPDTAIAGATVPVSWVGPGYDLDYIAVAKAGDSGYVNYSYTREGNPTPLQMPTEPGPHELRYVLNQDGAVVATRAIEISPLAVSLSAAAQGKAGEVLRVNWEGPGYDHDYVGIGVAGDDNYISYSYTNTGNPLAITLPDTPGQYELRYYLGQDNKIVARARVEVTVN